MKSLKKQRSNIDSISSGRWTAYAAAAAATGFAAAQTAEASIHYSGVINQRIHARGEATFPLGSGASLVASHINYVGGSSSFSAGGVARLFINGAQSASVNGSQGCYKDNDVCISNLNQRDAISTRPLVPDGGTLAFDSYFNFWHSFGKFRYRGTGLAGFKFNNGAGDQYGWVRFRMMGPRRNYFSVVDYAYGDPGDRVLAGQMSDHSAPSLDSLGGLALGAAGLLAWRQQRTK